MKKIFVLILALFMTLMFLGGCSQKQAENILRVGMECAYAPYNWTQQTDVNGAVLIKGSSDYAYGYDVMMAKYLADKLGYKLEVHKMDWDSLPIAVQSGIIDCAIAGQSITDERKMTVDFSTPYYYASIVCLVKADSTFAAATGISGLNGAVCTSQQNTVWYDVCLPQIESANILPAMDSAPAMLVSLTSGKCDLVVTDMPTAMAAVAVYPELKLLDFSGSPDGFLVSEQEINIGVSVKKGNADLLNKLNGALAGLTTADFEKMMNEAIRVQPLATE
ncbi:MAG: transporter substrate-binding domain-containing protein [Clostridiales bacterium]|nr:transporter substrate-binding domain-containing protein [Clostridiales bacterium]